MVDGNNGEVKAVREETDLTPEVENKAGRQGAASLTFIGRYLLMRMARDAFSSLSSKIVKPPPSLSVAQRRHSGESARNVPMLWCGGVWEEPRVCVTSPRPTHARPF